MNKTEVENYVKKLSSVKSQKYFYTFIGTKSNACYSFLKHDFLTSLIPHISFDNYTVKELHELAQKESDRLETEMEQKKKNPFKALWLGLRLSIVCSGLSLILGMDLANMSVLERREVGDAMVLAGLYLNCKD